MTGQSKRKIPMEKTRLDEWLESAPKHVKEMRRALKKLYAKIEKEISPRFKELARLIEIMKTEVDNGKQT